MNQPFWTIALSTVAFCFVAVAAAAEVDRVRARAAIEKILANETADVEALRRAVRDVLPQVEGNVLVTASLSAALDRDAKAIRSALEEAVETLTFEPKSEAETPKGFPAPTPVGEIRLQHYPAYRLARAEMKGGENSAFWTLFMHIKKHDIAMTAPVEMTYGDGKEKPKQTAMAFLYPDTATGDAGKDDKVIVTDVPASEAVSLGMRGNMTPERVAEARSRLEVWLKAHDREYEPAGPVRVMGYNSPFVPPAKRYFEVQLPVRARKPAE
jgi:hypothetical protein